MSVTTDTKNMSPELLKVAERAKADPQVQFYFLAVHITVEELERAYHRIRKDAAEGVDGVTKEQYGQDLESNLKNLHERLKAMKYRHQPIRRVHIPKEKGKTRPIGISCIEDKIVQGALREVLEAVYEQDFLPCSYGFRPGRSAHDALRAADQMVMNEGIVWVLEADIRGYFDSINREKLCEMLHKRVSDGSTHRLISKCLHVGVLDGEEYTTPEEGTAQGSIISPLLGNVYLHYVLDEWFEEKRKTLSGNARLIRYADDFIAGFTEEEDAKSMLKELTERMAEYGLTLHPEKTRIIPFRRPSKEQKNGKGPGTFDFLGFTLYWRRTRSGLWVLGMKTRKARLQKAIKAINDFCRRHQHLPKQEQHAKLSRRLIGHDNYFGVNGNFRCLSYLRMQVSRIWLHWLRRRSQRGRRLTWERFNAYLKAFPLPPPKIRVQIWGSP
jgi:RNA-directed DNA polymerase